jgi:hypothetical protein
MVKTKTKKPAAAKKRGRTAAAKTTKKSKAPSSVTRCPYASAEFYIESQDWGDNEGEGYSGEHPATSTPECGKLLRFKVPRKWLSLNVEEFEAYNFGFILHLKSGGHVSTRLQVLNEQGELKELLQSRTFNQAKNSGETTAEYMSGEWSGEASKVRIAYRRNPRYIRRCQIKFLEASLQLGADGTVPESEFGPGPGEDSDDEWMTLEAQLGRIQSRAAAAADDDDDVVITKVQTAAQRSAANRARAERDGTVLDVASDDD